MVLDRAGGTSIAKVGAIALYPASSLWMVDLCVYTNHGQLSDHSYSLDHTGAAVLAEADLGRDSNSNAATDAVAGAADCATS